MKAWLALSFVFAGSLNAYGFDKPIEVDAGPFRVISSNGPAPAKTRAGQLEQFRYAFGLITGVKDPQLVWPAEIVLSAKPYFDLSLARDSRIASIPENGPLPSAFLRNLAALFIEDNLKRLPADLEDGLISVLSTFQSEGTHISLGGPPSSGTNSRGRALLQMLVTDETTLGEVHVFLHNLQQGAEINIACRNAFAQPYSAIQSRLDQYLKTGSFGVGRISGAPINANRDFRADPLDSLDISLTNADLALASGDRNTTQLYRALHGPNADAGLALAAIQTGDKDATRTGLANAVSQGSKSARVYLESGILESDPSKKHEDFMKASELNPRWAEPYYQIAAFSKNPANQKEALKKAVSLAPRNLQWWRKLAEVAAAQGDFQEEAKAWTGASQAARNEDERSQLLQARADMEQQRSEAVEAERKRKRDEEAKDLERVKQQTLAEIHTAENRANQTLDSGNAAPVTGAVPYSSLDPQGPSFAGMLVRLDCGAKFSVLTVEDSSSKVSKFVIGDTAGLSLTCGPQKSPRKIIVEYQPKVNAKLGTVGEVRTVQLP